MRNGFTKFLTKELASDPQNSERNERSIKEFGSFFPKQKINAGSKITFLKEKSGTLNVFFGNELSGKISDKWLANAFAANYLCRKQPISEEAKNSFLEYWK